MSIERKPFRGDPLNREVAYRDRVRLPYAMVRRSFKHDPMPKRDAYVAR